MDLPEAFVEVEQVTVSDSLPKGRAAFSAQPHGQAHLLSNLSFTLAYGEWVTVFGSPNSGKSVLLRLLAGQMRPNFGRVQVNGQDPARLAKLPLGAVSVHCALPANKTIENLLRTYLSAESGRAPSMAQVCSTLGLQSILHRFPPHLSTTERVKLALARALLADPPLLLLDDAADILGVSTVRQILTEFGRGHTVLITTRSAAVAEQLDLPVLLLHGGRLVHRGTREEIAMALACPKVVDVWVEGVRYEFVRRLRSQAGILTVRLVPATNFSGQKLRVTLRSARFLPAFYDLLTQTTLVRVAEWPVPLADILSQMLRSQIAANSEETTTTS